MHRKDVNSFVSNRRGNFSSPRLAIKRELLCLGFFIHNTSPETPAGGETVMNIRSSVLSGNWCYLRRSFRVERLVCELAVLMALLTVAPVEAGQNQWTSTGPANSGPIISLAVDPSAPETVYAGSGTSGMMPGTVFKSTNGGASWVPANNGLPSVFVRALVIDPQTPSTIYAGTGGTFIGPVFRGMFKSIDGGMNWTPLATTPGPGSVTSVAMDPQNPATLYVGTTDGFDERGVQEHQWR